MKKERTKKDKLLDVVKKMPPMYHTLPGEIFDMGKSEVIKWLIGQPEILDFLWRSIRGKGGASCLVRYDPGTGKWQGVDFDEN